PRSADHGCRFTFPTRRSSDLKQMAEMGGADVVIENVGPATWRQSLRSLKKGGRMAICGATSGTKVELTLPVLWFKELELIGSTRSEEHTSELQSREKLVCRLL